jgi:hypothetical protein
MKRFDKLFYKFEDAFYIQNVCEFLCLFTLSLTKLLSTIYITFDENAWTIWKLYWAIYSIIHICCKSKLSCLLKVVISTCWIF